MANLTKKEKSIVELYVRYFGKAPSVDEIKKYNDVGNLKQITTEIIGDSDVIKPKNNEDFVNSVFQNLFGRDATLKQMNKYIKFVEKGKNLPLGAIKNAGTKSDKAVYEAKKAIAIMLAEQKITTNYDLDKITKDTYADVYNLKTKKLLVDTVAQLETKLDAMPENVTGQTYTLTTGVDNLVGSEKGDVFNSYDFVSQISGTATSTLNSYDTLDGKGGKDTFNILTDIAIASPVLNLTSIETVNVTSTNNVTLDGTDWEGTTALNVTKGIAVNLTAGESTAVSVTGILTGGSTTIDGGSTQTVNVKTGAVTLDNAAGDINVTHTAQDAAISVKDGANVTVTATATTTQTISVGAANETATGDVVVTQNLNSTGAAGLTGGAINVTGGKTVTVDVNSTNSATAGTNAITTGTITVTGDANTTAVTVNQTEAVAAVPATPATAAVTEVASVQFADITTGDTVTLDGLTFTAAKNLTAAEVAAAFANLKAGATHGQAKADNGIYSGALANYNTGAVSTDTVVFTATEAKALADLTDTGDGTATATVTTDGVNGVDAVAAVGAIANGVVTIANGGTNNTIKTVTVDGYAAGSSITSNVLTDVTLKNSAGTATVSSAVASLNLTVDDVIHGLTLTAGNLKTLNLTTTGEESAFNFAGTGAAAIETLTIAAGAVLTTAGSNLSALKTVTISGTGDVVLGDISGATTTALTSTTTGDISATVDGTRATVTTGAGNDTITVDAATTVTKTISLGAGDDKLILSGITSVNVDTAAISGGEGTDTIVLTAANAVTLSDLANSTIFKSKVTGFEKLEIGNAGTVAVNVGNLGFNYVVTNVNTALTLADMANNGTVELNGASTATIVQVKDAALAGNTTDVLNVIANVAGTGVNNGTLTAANVETINITATDTLLDNDADGIDDAVDTSTLTLVATSATAVTVTGNANLTLNMAGNTAVTSIDASTLTGDLTVISANTTTSATINGGLGNDTITAAALDKVFGGAGNDTLEAASFAELTGGTGADMFVTVATTVNTNTFATIKDFNAAEGDSIKFASAVDFNNTKVDALATFDLTLDAAAAAAGTNGVSWFTFTDNATQSTDTYLVYNAAGATFSLGTDTVIKIAGVVDFSTAAFNDSTETIAFA